MVFLNVLKKIAHKLLPGSLYTKMGQRFMAKRQERFIRRGKEEEFLKEKYFSVFGRQLSFENPQAYTEKIQWLKLYGLNPEKKTLCSDKYAVRAFVAQTIGEKYLVPIIKINGKERFESVDEIDFSLLPNEFVIQCNHGSGMTEVITDKKRMSEKDFAHLKRLFKRHLKTNLFRDFGTMEFQYDKIPPCIFFTQRLKMHDDCPDWKFLCFNGEPRVIWVDTHRFTNHKRSFFNEKFEPLPLQQSEYDKDEQIERPAKLEEMLTIARKLSQGFEAVRVDLYYLNNEIYFGELTFTNAGGFGVIHPDEWDFKLGSMMKLDLSRRETIRARKNQ